MVFNEVVLIAGFGPSKKDVDILLKHMEQLGNKKKFLKKNIKYFGFIDIFEDKHRCNPYLIQAVKDLKTDGLIIEKFKGDKYRIVEHNDPYWEQLETPKDVKFITIKK
jgi:hypothetical protein